MKRTYKKRTALDFKRFGQLAFTLFVVFIAYKILTPPSNETARVASPDGSKSARLLTEFYFDGQPSYKIHYRETGKRIWQSLFYLPAYTNIPPERAEAALEWSNDSERIDFLMNGSSIWHHVFQK